MFRPTLLLLRTSSGIPSRLLPRAPGARRFLSTAPPSQRSRSWKSSAARWGLAIAGVYYYNTSNVFADEPGFGLATRPSPEDDSTDAPSLESITREREARKARQRSTLASIADGEEESRGSSSTDSRVALAQGGVADPAETDAETTGGGGGGRGDMESAEELEGEADQQGAFNPETGEINWDCPCLGGMAHGPCGEEFKTAFSCFVYSEQEPKGMDCIDKFKGMQDCFRLHPDIYGAELEDDDMENEEAARAVDGTPAAAASASSSSSSDPPSDSVKSNDDDPPSPAPVPIEANATHPTSPPAPAPPSPPSRVSAPAESSSQKKETPASPPSTEPESAADEKETAKATTTKKKNKQVQERRSRPLDETDALVPKQAYDARSR